MTDEWIVITIIMSGIGAIVGMFVGGELAMWMDRREAERERKRGPHA